MRFKEVYVTTENIQGTRFSEGFVEDIKYYEERGLPMLLDTEYGHEHSSSIRILDVGRKMFPCSGRKDWTHDNVSYNIITKKRVIVNHLPEDLFTL